MNILKIPVVPTYSYQVNLSARERAGLISVLNSLSIYPTTHHLEFPVLLEFLTQLVDAK